MVGNIECKSRDGRGEQNRETGFPEQCRKKDCGRRHCAGWLQPRWPQRDSKGSPCQEHHGENRGGSEDCLQRHQRDSRCEAIRMQRREDSGRRLPGNRGDRKADGPVDPPNGELRPIPAWRDSPSRANSVAWPKNQFGCVAFGGEANYRETQDQRDGYDGGRPGMTGLLYRPSIRRCQP